MARASSRGGWRRRRPGHIALSRVLYLLGVGMVIAFVLAVFGLVALEAHNHAMLR